MTFDFTELNSALNSAAGYQILEAMNRKAIGWFCICTIMLARVRYNWEKDDDDA